MQIPRKITSRQDFCASVPSFFLKGYSFPAEVKRLSQQEMSGKQWLTNSHTFQVMIYHQEGKFAWNGEKKNYIVSSTDKHSIFWATYQTRNKSHAANSASVVMHMYPICNYYVIPYHETYAPRSALQI